MSGPSTVAVLTPVTGGPYFGEVLDGILREVGAAGGRVVLLQTALAGRSRDEVVDDSGFAAHTAWAEVDAVILIARAASGAYLQQHRDLGRPVVLVSDSIDGFEAASASPDNVEGIHVAIDHLIGHGHRQIGFAGNLVQSDMRERLDAYRLALTSHGVAPDPSWLFAATDNGEVGGRGVADQLVAASLPVTALVVATDRNALGLLERVQEAGIRVPGQLAVVGFDDIESGSFSSPTLSTVSQHFDDVGALAARLVLAQLRGERVGFHAHRPASTFLPRESCGCGSTDGPAPAAGAGTTLAEGVLALLEPTAVDAERLTWEAEAFTSAVRTASASGQDVPLDRAKAFARQVQHADPTPEVLRGVVEVVTDHLLILDLAGSAGVVRAAASVSAALWQAQATSYLARSGRSEAALLQQFAIGLSLLDRDRVDPRQLAWMEATQVPMACLALWEAEPGLGLLRLVGVHDPDLLLTGLAGTTVEAEHFPPAAMIAAVEAQAGLLTFVLPVRGRGRDWGLLAVAGAVDATSASAGQTYDQWAALLASSFEQDELHASIRGSEERYSLVAGATNDGLWDWDLVEDTIYYSARCTELLGGSQPAGDGTPARWFDAVHPDDVAALRRILGDATQGERRAVEVEHRARGADGRYHHLLCRALPVGPADGPARRMVGSLSDIDPRKQLEEQLRHVALYDDITGLPNRKLFIERLTAAIAQARRTPGPHYAVLFLDLDGFKAVNDQLGHLMGDRLLAKFGERLRSGLREVDLAARFGGDEFAVLLHNAEPNRVSDVVERMQRVLAEPITLEGREVVVTASVGVTTSAMGYENAEQVLRDADIAMYQAKTRERGSHAYYEEGMQAVGGEEPGQKQELRAALDGQQLTMHFQPVIELAGNRIDRFEALVRWRHPTRGLLEAASFLADMEQAGLIVEMGHWVLDEVCRQLAEWQASPVGRVKVSVNLAEREFWDPGLVRHLRACLERFDLAPDRLTLEVTESTIVRRPDQLDAVLGELRSLGVGVQIDNVGSVRSSFHALSSFPVEALKIDGSLIHDLASDARTASLVEVIFALGEALGVEVVAEGVETRDQLERLRAMGCRKAQGMWFARATDASAAGEAFRRSHVPRPRAADVAPPG